MEKETFIIKNTQEIAPCVAWIKEHVVLGPIEVRVSTEKRSRSALQNSLYWKWCGELGAHQGLLKDEVHEYLKRRFAVPIFSRDDLGYMEAVLAVSKINKEGMTFEAMKLAKVISKLTSTTDFTVKQMTEYLYDIEMYAAEIGAHLTFPEEAI